MSERNLSETILVGMLSGLTKSTSGVKTHPERLTEGCTVRIPKDPQKRMVPFNYWPITCLSTTWKLLLGIMAAKMTRHMSEAQKGFGRYIRGSKHQHLEDRAVTRHCKTRLTNLCTAWTEYKRAYNLMHCAWIQEGLEPQKNLPTLC